MHPDTIALKNISAYIEDTTILQNLDLHLEPGTVHLLSGPSGCGKSTLLQALARLFPEDGSEKVEGSWHIPDHLRTGMVFQDPESQFCMMRVEEEMAFVLENLGTPPERMEEEITGVLAETGLTPLRHRLIHELSGGEKQKTALASVLLLKPHLLLLDEALANLDPAAQQTLAALVMNIQKKRKCTVVIVDHQPENWLSFIDRVHLMSGEGTITASGTPEETFIGSGAETCREEGIYIPFPYRKKATASRRRRSGKEDPVLEMSALTPARGDACRVQLSLRPGEITALAGSNGRGKTSLLQTAAGLQKPRSGEVFLKGKPLSSWSERELRRRTGYVFQQPEHQFIAESVKEELAFGPRLSSAADAEKKALEKMKQFRLAHRADVHPFSLSGGQKRRLSTAVMLEADTEVLFLDEPTFGQDAASIRSLTDLLHRLRLKGTAVLLVTHDMNLVHELCDRVVVLLKEKHWIGEPEALWADEALMEKSGLLLPAGRMQKEEFACSSS
ncbi:ABC transporter ATP-binding protein [Alkalicoccus urumqiensis]|nr:ABC transporter ATP-binding protein [Alkalicoccus urumqiensis]